MILLNSPRFTQIRCILGTSNLDVLAFAHDEGDPADRAKQTTTFPFGSRICDVTIFRPLVLMRACLKRVSLATREVVEDSCTAFCAE